MCKKVGRRPRTEKQCFLDGILNLSKSSGILVAKPIHHGNSPASRCNPMRCFCTAGGRSWLLSQRLANLSVQYLKLMFKLRDHMTVTSGEGVFQVLMTRQIATPVDAVCLMFYYANSGARGPQGCTARAGSHAAPRLPTGKISVMHPSSERRGRVASVGHSAGAFHECHGPGPPGSAGVEDRTSIIVAPSIRRSVREPLRDGITA